MHIYHRTNICIFEFIIYIIDSQDCKYIYVMRSLYYKRLVDPRYDKNVYKYCHYGKIWIYLCFLSLFMVKVDTISFAQSYPLVHSYRPRILADSSRISWMKDNLTVTGDYQNTYNAFVYAYNSWWINDPQLYLLGVDSTLWTWDWDSPWANNEAIYTVFLYKLTENQ